MKDADKIRMVDQIINMVRASQTSDDMPVMIGELCKPIGQNGFERCEVGHPVFEFKGKYVIYMKNPIETVKFQYNKPQLEGFITFPEKDNVSELQDLLNAITGR